MNKLFLITLIASLNASIMKISTDELIALEGDEPEYRQLCANWHNGKCSLCYASFFDGNKCVKPTKKVDHCLSYKADGVCETCQLHFGLVNGRCDRIPIEGCVRTLDQNLSKCDVCKSGWKVTIDGKCGEASKCSIEHCDLCMMVANVEYCDLCQNGFVVYSFEDSSKKPMMTCVPEVDGTKYCQSTAMNKQAECDTCQLNYYMDDTSICHKSDAYDMELYGFSMIQVLSVLVAVLFF